jgi:REP element-mobilizing transposase RayT
MPNGCGLSPHLDAYGWWLPNDPRGSSSHEIRVERIAELGELHHGRKPVQPRASELRQFHDAARAVLKHELLSFSEDAIDVIGSAFAAVVSERRYTCYACAIMPDHVHMLIRRHREKAEQMMSHFQEASRTALIAAQSREADHPVWGGPGWKVFLNSRPDMERIIRYIRDNPIKAGRAEQDWGFVSDYNGWLQRPARET